METVLNEKYEFRCIHPDEAIQAAQMEQVCFPPNEACSIEMMLARVAAAPDSFLTVIDRKSGLLAGMLCGLPTDETVFRDAFFEDAGLYDPAGKNVMILGLEILPEYRGQGLARELVRRYAEAEREKGRRQLILTCLPDKVEMYEKMGFQNDGIANSAWGGEEWYEMSRFL